MNLRRMLQLLATNFIGQGVNVITQLLVPPLFLHFYAHGLEAYGEWIALSSSVNYLNTLNYGIQTYANNQATILYQRDQIDEAKTVQAGALRLLLALIALFTVFGAMLLILPVAQWLNLKQVGTSAASLTVYLLIIQMVVNMLFSLLTNSFMVVGKLPRGNQWSNAQRLFSVFALSAAVWLQAPFPLLALVQICSLIPFLVLVVIDIRRIAPILMPSLRYGSLKQDLTLIRPSGHFVLIALAGFLTWQGPVLLIQKTLGAAAVADFALVRVVFQMSRQILSVTTYAVSQDITLLVGQRDWPQLRRLYDLSERVVIFLIPIVSIGSLLACPILFTIWLHSRALYDPLLCLLMAMTSAVLGLKEHKTQFQASSNVHEKLSLFAIAGYSVMLGVSIPITRFFGLPGFMCVWLAWEILQTAYVLNLNAKLLPAELEISKAPVARLYIFMICSFACVAWPAFADVRWPLSAVAGMTLVTVSLLGWIAYHLFGLAEVRTLIQSKFRSRFKHNA